MPTFREACVKGDMLTQRRQQVHSRDGDVRTMSCLVVSFLMLRFHRAIQSRLNRPNIANLVAYYADDRSQTASLLLEVRAAHNLRVGSLTNPLLLV